MKLDKQFLNKFSKKTGYSIEKSKEILEAEINKFIEEDSKLSKKDTEHITCWDVLEFNLKKHYKKKLTLIQPPAPILGVFLV